MTYYMYCCKILVRVTGEHLSKRPIICSDSVFYVISFRTAVFFPYVYHYNNAKSTIMFDKRIDFKTHSIV